MFKRNEGTLDRIARLALGIVLLPTGLVLLGGMQGNVWGLLVALPGVIGLVTALTGFCPTYVLFGISTLESEKKPSVASLKGN
jgi:hypothetical protein